MYRFGFLLCALCAISFSAPKGATKSDDVKADSVVYDKPVEWRVFSAGAPVTAFAVAKDYLWYATAEEVVSNGIKKA
jgi:hypothetical protein